MSDQTRPAAVSDPPRHSGEKDHRRSAGPLLVWFAVLGGPVAWAAHLLAAWMLTELACIQGHQQILGLDLRTVAVLATVAPCAVALAALLVALRAGRSLRRDEGDRRSGRARFMVRVGAWLDGLSVLMILFGGAAVLTLPACAQSGTSTEGALATSVSLHLQAAAFLPVGAGAVVPGNAGPHDSASSVVLVGLVAVAAAYLAGAARCAGNQPSLRAGVTRLGVGHAVAFLTGLGALTLALGPWADRLADRSFAAHMGQHMLLVVIAAPLLALGAPGVPFVLLLPRRARLALARTRHRVRYAAGTRALFLPVTAWVVHVAALWLWHLPPAFEAALHNEWLHAAEHASFFLTAWLFWWHVLAAGPRRVVGPAAVLYVFATTLPAAALGAVLTFAKTPLYPTEAAAARASGADALTDQQVAGLIMWVPPDVVYLLVTVALFLPWLTRLAGQDQDFRQAPYPPVAAERGL